MRIAFATQAAECAHNKETELETKGMPISNGPDGNGIRSGDDTPR